MRETRTEKNYISKKDFRKWVNTMYNQFMESNAVVQAYENYTYVYLRSKVGIAKASPNDAFDNRIGIAYAWARCTGQPVYYEKEKYTPKTGEWVYVNIVNDQTRYLRYVGEGINYYWFNMNCGHLIVIDKDRVTDITPAN